MTNSDIIRMSDWVSVQEARELLGVTRQRIHQLLKEQRIRALRVGKHSVVVHRKDLERYKAQRERVRPY